MVNRMHKSYISNFAHHCELHGASFVNVKFAMETCGGKICFTLFNVLRSNCDEGQIVMKQIKPQHLFSFEF